MAAYTEWFCDLCNPSCQRRDPGDEVNTGYVRTPAGQDPPSKWFAFSGRQRGLACGRCEASRKLLAVVNEAHGELRERHPALEAVAGLAGSTPGTEVRGRGVTATNTTGWPSHTSPFGAHGEPGDAPRVDEPDDRSVRADGD